MKTISIEATSISDAWHMLLFKTVEEGRTFTIDQGSFAGQKRCELDYVTVQITHPETEPLLPKVNPLLGFPDPVIEGYLDDYLPYLMTGEEKEGEAYTYGQRLCRALIPNHLDLPPDLYTQVSRAMVPGTSFHYEGSEFVSWKKFVNQMELMIWTYKKMGHRNNQMILQVAQPTDMCLKDPPCLRHIDTRIQDGKLHFFPYFRSWDLFGGFPANLAAIELMKQYCAAEIGVENGEIIASSKGLHIYDYVFEIAEAIRGKKMEEFR